MKKSGSRMICEFLGEDKYNMCNKCPFGYCYGEYDVCPTTESVEEAIEMLDEISKRAKALANKMTNL